MSEQNNHSCSFYVRDLTLESSDDASLYSFFLKNASNLLTFNGLSKADIT